jgi:hypothetical protein
MADVFISYAKSDRPLALKLAAMLEAEGWKVWWDTSLTIGDDFRNEIMSQLGRARAVVVIWTDASIKSDWVRSEAGRAQADRKLIPVKLEHLTYKDLPPPFDVLHTENVDQENKIKAAIVAQLAKPAVEPSVMALLTKGFKYELLTWVGIIGGALTLFTNLGSVFKLADWARVLVEHWKEWTHAFWLWAFGWLGIHLGPGWTPVLSFLVFGSLLAIGQAVKFKSTIKNQEIKDKYQGKSFHPLSWRILLCVIGMFVVYELIDLWAYRYYPGDLDYYLAIGVIIFIISPIVLFARHRLHAAISTSLLLMFFIIIAFDPLRDLGRPGNPDLDVVGATTLVLICLLPLILLSVAPAKAISRRLIFLALGLLLLIGLNELSKLGLDVTAPKQG